MAWSASNAASAGASRPRSCMTAWSWTCRLRWHAKQAEPWPLGREQAGPPPARQGWRVSRPRFAHDLAVARRPLSARLNDEPLVGRNKRSALRQCLTNCGRVGAGYNYASFDGAGATSGASAANSAACLRISAASAVAQRVPVRRLVLEPQATRRREILGRHRVPVRRLVLEQDGHVHRILVTRRADGARRVCGQAQHSLVAGQHLCDEAADAEPDGALLQAFLPGSSNALSQPLRGRQE